MLSSGPTSPSYAGTWGVERRARLQGGKSVANHESFVTTSGACFSAQNFSNEKTDANNKFAKFHALRTSGAAIMDSQKSKDWSNGEGGDRNEGFGGSTFGVANGMLNKSGSMQLGRTASTDSCGELNQTVSASPTKISSEISLQRTVSKLLTLSDAPIAVGRSGIRTERGISNPNSLCGERLMVSSVEPQKDSQVQRSWLYAEDPALQIRVGKRTVQPIDATSLGVSLQVGEELKNDGKGSFAVNGWKHGRKAILTGVGDLSCKTGRMRAGVYQDEYVIDQTN